MKHGYAVDGQGNYIHKDMRTCGNPVVNARSSILRFPVGWAACCIQSSCLILTTKWCEWLGEVKVDEQTPGIVKTPARTSGFGKVEVQLIASFISRQSFRQGPSGR